MGKILSSFKKATLMALLLTVAFLCIFWLIQTNLNNHFPSQPEAKKVLVIANLNSPVSLRVAQYYMKRRGIPTSNFLTLNLPDSTLQPIFETIDYSTYQKQVEQPVKDFLNSKKLTNEIRYLVLTRGVPLRVREVIHPLADGKTFIQNQSLDSTLAALDYRISPIKFKDIDYKGGKEPFGLLTPNLYWRQTYTFEHRLSGGYLVTRLDGYSEADARALIDRSLIPRPSLQGVVLIDLNGGNESSGASDLIDIFDPKSCSPQTIPQCTPLPQGMLESVGDDFNNDLRLSAQLLRKLFPQLSVMVASPETFATSKNLIGYASWGSNDTAFSLNDYRSLRFLPGAVADTVVSSSGRSFFPTRSGQSLIADLITPQVGITGIRGYTDEPELQGIGSPLVLFSNYFGGANLATAYYRSIRFVGWRDLVLGDPLATAVFNNEQ